MSKLKTNYPRPEGCNDRDWGSFRKFNSDRRLNNEPEWPFDNWKQQHEAGWPCPLPIVPHNLQRPEGAEEKSWNRYIAFRSYRRGQGMPCPSYEDYLEYYSEIAKQEIKKYANDKAKLEKLEEIRLQNRRFARKRKAKKISAKSERIIAKINHKAKNARLDS